MRTELSVCVDGCNPSDFQQQNVARKLTSLRKCVTTFVKSVMRFKRTPATHIFVLMISQQDRRTKLYALPIQCVPYAGLKERDIRRLVSTAAKVITDHGLKVTGKLYTVHRILS